MQNFVIWLVIKDDDDVCPLIKGCRDIFCNLIFDILTLSFWRNDEKGKVTVYLWKQF